MSQATEARKFIRTLNRFGFEVELDRGHQSWRITHPDVPDGRVNMACTPSDHRWKKNTIAYIMREFGIKVPG